jgi:hypothetical protein
LGQRSRKKGRRRRPPGAAARPAGTPLAGAPTANRPGQGAQDLSRTQRRDAAVREGLKPLAPGERPGAVVAGAIIAALIGLANLVAYIAGAKIGGKHPAAGGIVVFTGLMLACAVGMWRMWYGAVLAFMALLAIVATLFGLLLIEASNLLGFLVPPFIIAGAGYLFWKLVRSLSRIQMPRYPGS